jgi:hypothetical protein
VKFASRPIDIAMDQDRADKNAIRSLWVEEVKYFATQFPNDDGPLFLTLAGAEGKDVRALVEAGLLQTAENNAIAPDSARKVVAVENSPPAVLQLQSRFPGLKILEVPFQSLVRGHGPFTWPTGEHTSYCRARVVNLDLASSLHARMENDQIEFPELLWISKLSQIHATAPRRNWSLCLTFQGSLQVPDAAVAFGNQFLAENFTREPRFADHCHQLLGKPIYDSIANQSTTQWAALPAEKQQELLMVFVPKVISHLVSQHGWRVAIRRNLRYGGGDGAPMVTWILRFESDPNAQATPDALYRDALRNILKAAGIVTSDGEIIPLSFKANQAKVTGDH